MQSVLRSSTDMALDAAARCPRCADWSFPSMLFETRNYLISRIIKQVRFHTGLPQLEAHSHGYALTIQHFPATPAIDIMSTPSECIRFSIDRIEDYGFVSGWPAATTPAQRRDYRPQDVRRPDELCASSTHHSLAKSLAEFWPVPKLTALIACRPSETTAEPSIQIRLLVLLPPSKDFFPPPQMYRCERFTSGPSCQFTDFAVSKFSK
jgi:hypothetical protein